LLGSLALPPQKDSTTGGWSEGTHFLPREGVWFARQRIVRAISPDGFSIRRRKQLNRKNQLTSLFTFMYND
jgi:hypothetical protein